MDYYTTLILIANMTALVLIINTISNDNFNKRTKHGFIITLVFIIAGGTCEWIGISINGIFLFNLKKLKILLHSYIKLLEQIIVPVMIFEFTELIFIKDKKSFDRKIVVGVCIQMINENIKTCWISITIATALFYLYYSNIIQVLDGLISLLNQRCYKNRIERSNDIQFTIIIFDVNSFNK